jgi:hypothetical protein
MTKWAKNLVTLLVAVMIAAIPVRVDMGGFAPLTAHAQSNDKKQTLFDLLFNKNKKSEPQAQKPAARRPSVQPRMRARAAPRKQPRNAGATRPRRRAPPRRMPALRKTPENPKMPALCSSLAILSPRGSPRD